MRLTIEDQEMHLTQAASLAGVDRWPQDAEAVAIMGDTDENPRGIFVVSHFTNGDCLINFVSNERKDWATPTLFHRLAAYLFEYKGLDRITATISVENTQSLILALKTGFQIDGRIRRGAIDGSDAILFSMLRDESPWLQKEPEPDERTET